MQRGFSLVEPSIQQGAQCSGLTQASIPQGFSLVELSIVLVILGLLTGGILAGQSLIRASELRAVSTEITKLQTAGLTFRDKYFALPGDMDNATQFWNAAGPALTCGAAIGVGTQTCDGNADGFIMRNAAATSHEAYRAWQHLANAGLIEGSYSGVKNAAAPWQTIGVNIPASRLSNMGYVIYYAGAIVHANWFPLEYGHMLSYGRLGNTEHMGRSFYGEEVWNLDTKMDDGRPASGTMIATNSNTQPNCVSSDDPATAIYVLNDRSDVCLFVMRNFW